MSKTVKIKNNQPRLYTANGVTLQPGLNTLSEADAQKFLSHPHIAIKVERKLIELKDGAKVAPAKTEVESVEDSTKEPTPFDDLEYNIEGKGAHDSMDAIADIEDVEYLKHIAETETRSTVKKVAEKRIAKLAEAEQEHGGNE